MVLIICFSIRLSGLNRFMSPGLVFMSDFWVMKYTKSFNDEIY